MRKKSFEFLKSLLSVPSPSGHEVGAQRVWCDYARQYADEVRTDAYGNAVAILNPKGTPSLSAWVPMPWPYIRPMAAYLPRW